MYPGSRGRNKWSSQFSKSSSVEVPLSSQKTAQRWQAENPPSVKEWVNVVTETIWKEKVVYTKRRNIREFGKMWNLWLE